MFSTPTDNNFFNDITSNISLKFYIEYLISVSTDVLVKTFVEEYIYSNITSIREEEMYD